MTLFATTTGKRATKTVRDIGTSYADIMPASGSVVVLDSLLVSNKTGGAITCTFAHVSGSDTTVILPAVSVAANSIYQLQNHHVSLDPGDKFQIKAGAGASLDATLVVIQSQQI